MGEALISGRGTKAVLRVGPWAAEVDARELQVWAAYGGFEMTPAGGREFRIDLRDAADGHFVILAWADLTKVM
jgi:hypothetical protein